ncbi:MAG: hypothetical protein KAQ88_00420, partial [Hyphomicrobiaceae bacterium]|nr:hypothetical protein [Hyphomicrobiaceae bacterium]
PPSRSVLDIVAGNPNGNPDAQSRRSYGECRLESSRRRLCTALQQFLHGTFPGEGNHCAANSRKHGYQENPD